MYRPAQPCAFQLLWMLALSAAALALGLVPLYGAFAAGIAVAVANGGLAVRLGRDALAGISFGFFIPVQATRPWTVTVRIAVISAGNGTPGTGRSGPAAASSPTVARCPPRIRCRPSIGTARSSRPRWAAVIVASSGRVRHQRCAAEWLAFSTTPLRLPRRGQISTPTWWYLASPANEAVIFPLPGSQTVDIRSNRHRRVRPPSLRATASKDSARCPKSSAPASIPRQRPDADSTPTIRCACRPCPTQQADPAAPASRTGFPHPADAR
jgi:hypothetical protein